MPAMTQPTVSTKWLQENLKNPDIRLFDGSWHMPGSGPDSGRDAKAEFDKRHIPGARFFDIDEISDHRSELPHTVPTIEKFMSRMRAMGVGDGHLVVAYDSAGLFSAARVWWLCRLMGMKNVAVLDGGLPKWLAENRPVSDEAPLIRDRHMSVDFQSQMLVDVTQIATASKLGDRIIVDARAPERFRGDVPEPRPGLRSGHIPGARNVFFQSLLAEDGTLKPPAEIRMVFERAGVDLSKPILTTCGSGVTAAVLILALESIGKTDHALYDGSWSEWGMYDDLPIETGPA